MKLYGQFGEPLPFKRFTFPDGQPHIELLTDFLPQQVTIETAIRNPAELFEVLLMEEILDNRKCDVALDIRYLMGARMDRRIDDKQPNTLGVVCELLSEANFRQIRILDPHSTVATMYLDAITVLPTRLFGLVLDYITRVKELVIVAPDKGATQRVSALVQDKFPIIQASKVRDSATGKLSGFTIVEGSVKDKHCLIVDDICDGGGTFVGLAQVLLSEGAAQVDLFVTHGIFSKGQRLENITNVYTTDSYWDPRYLATQGNLTVLPVNMQRMS